ncbi:PilN domain-containing protein [Yersinia pekkanenii]|uniref:Type IV pilus biogenesis protein PilN n=1 Tax=Yersinia pekkanenii TaxID=1288385 RepID=A0A0T9PHP3_9GAMM|nr:PilN domain-containing protein [Yersinia pekkanenii]CNH65753.1 type IV pilus biogenesis protein PilN [Yersinia pekkanenii]CRY67088.1 type IV pilus biogenesis protein PilN [Yersinia pekkanenii]
MYQVNFSSWRAEHQLDRYRFWRNAGLCQCTLFVITLLVIQVQSRTAHIRQQVNLAALSQQQSLLSQHYQELQQAMAQLRHREHRAQIYRQALQPARRYSTLLQQLSQQIPDSCWLVSLIPQDERVVFEAISQNYAAINVFLVQLGRQPLLENVHLQGITQQEDGHFRFVVWAEWRDGGENDE